MDTGAHLLLVRPIAESGSSGLIDDALHIQACYAASVLCCLPLPVVEVRCSSTSAFTSVMSFWAKPFNRSRKASHPGQ